MSKQRTTSIAWIAWGVVMIGAMVALGVRQWNISGFTTSVELTSLQLLMEVLYWLVLIPAAVPAYASVGALIAARHSRNRIGWLCLALAFVIVTQDIAWQYAARGITIAPGALPATMPVDWYATVLGAFWLPLPALILLYYPLGYIASRPRRVLLWWILANMGVTSIASVLRPRLSFDQPNPTSIPALAPLADAVLTLEYWLALGTLLAVLVVLALRWRRASFVERQQLKWLVFTGAVSIVAGIVAVGHGTIYGLTLPNVLIGAVAIAGISIGVPVAIGIAITRYRLYNIDVLINRTLVYGILTALIALIYVATVVVLQRLVQFVTGTLSSELVTVVSTLAIATLFSPLRRAIQTVIDQRFYRRKYDAQRTLHRFSMRLRDETDLDHLTVDLVGVVEQTLQPASVSLWLREPKERMQA
jgi:hypothetical protein